MRSGNGIQIPLPTEHAYHLGWTSYHNGLAVSVNPYNTDEEKLHDAWIDGYSTAENVSNRRVKKVSINRKYK